MAKRTSEEVTNAVISWREQRKAYFAGRARGELVSPVPAAPSVRVQKVRTVEDRIRDIVRSEAFAAEARRQGYETEAEANDFDVGDDDQYMPGSPHEQEIDGVPIEDLLLEYHEHMMQQAEPRQGPPPLPPSSPETRQGAKRGLTATEEEKSKKPASGAESAIEGLETEDLSKLKKLLSRL